MLENLKENILDFFGYRVILTAEGRYLAHFYWIPFLGRRLRLVKKISDN